MSSGGHGHGGGLPGVAAIEHWLHGLLDNGHHITLKQIFAVFVVINITFFILFPQQGVYDFGLLAFLSPIWVSVILGYFTWKRFVDTNKAEAIHARKYVLLEVLMPRETHRTPFAMETFFSNLNIGSGETTWYKKLFQGGTRPWWSFEIVSLGGRIHFYIWTPEGYRRLVESYFYAQYPEVQIIEAEDYSRLVDPTSHDYQMWGTEFGLAKPDPYPIRSYVDYKLEPGAKPEEVVDPMGTFLETLSSIGPGEQFWMQIIIRMSKNEKFEGTKKADGKEMTFNDVAATEIDSIRSKAVKKSTYTDIATGKVIESEGFPNPTKGQIDLIAAIDRKTSKQLFDVGIRSIYLGTNESYQGIMIPSMLNMFKPFNNPVGNSIVIKPTWFGIFNDWPWEDKTGHHKHHIAHELLRVYRQRAYYHEPYQGPWSIMSTEELATLYHVPTSGVTAPGITRIQSSTGGAPINLPS